MASFFDGTGIPRETERLSRDRQWPEPVFDNSQSYEVRISALTGPRQDMSAHSVDRMLEGPVNTTPYSDELTQEVKSFDISQLHPSLQPRGGVDPDDVDYWNQLGETRGD